MTPKQYDRQHLRHLSAMDRRIDQFFDKALKRLASYGIFLNKPLGDQPFTLWSSSRPATEPSGRRLRTA